MVDINKITDIQTAKDQKYNGSDLTTELKAIFDHDNVKNLAASDIKEVATLLDNVLQGKAATSANTTILTNLQGKKTTKASFYTAINSIQENSKGIYDLAIEKLESFGNDDSNGKVAEYQKLIDAKDVEIKLVDKEIEEIEANAKIIAEEKVKIGREIKKIEEGQNLLKQFKDDIVKANAKVDVSDVKGIQKSWYDFYDNKEEFWQADFSKQALSFLGQAPYKDRSWFIKADGSGISIIGDIITFFKEFDESDFEKAVQASKLSDKASVIADFKKIKKTQYAKKFVDNGVGQNRLTNYFHNEFGSLVGKGKKYQKIVDIKDEDLTLFPISDALNFLHEVSQDKDLFDPSNKEVGYANVLNKKNRTIEYRAFSEDLNPTSPNYFTIDDYITENKKDKLHELKSITTPNLSLGEAMAFFDIVFEKVDKSTWEKYSKSPDFELTQENNIRLRDYVKKISDSDYGKLLKDGVVDEKFFVSLILQTKMGSCERKAILKDYTGSTIYPYDARNSENRLVMYESITGEEVEVSEEKSLIDPTASDYKRYISIGLVDDKISELEIDILMKKSQSDGMTSGMGDIYGKSLVEAKAKRNRLVAEKQSYQKLLSDAKLGTIQEIAKVIDDAIGTGVSSKKFTTLEILEIRNNISNLKLKAKTQKQNIDQKYIDAENELRALETSLVISNSQIMEFESLNKGDLKKRVEKASELGRLSIYIAAYNDAANYRKLDDLDELNKKGLQNKKDGKPIIDEEDDNTGTLTSDNLKNALYLASADQTLVNNWNNSTDLPATFKTETKIKGVIDKVASDATKKTNFIIWVKGKKSMTEDGEAAWTKFMANTPKDVIMLIVEYRLEKESSLKTDTKQNMIDWKSTDGKKELNMSEYGEDDDNKGPNDDGIIQYLFEETVGKSHSIKDIATENGGGNGSDTNWYNPADYPVAWSIFAVSVFAIAGLVFYFWKSISEWWSPSDDEDLKDDNE